MFINGDLERRVPHNLNMSFNYVEGESLIMGIKGLAVSSGSACTSASLEPSYVLRAPGFGVGIFYVGPFMAVLPLAIRDHYAGGARRTLLHEPGLLGRDHRRQHGAGRPRAAADPARAPDR